jgi:hypothetical protein
MKNIERLYSARRLLMAAKRGCRGGETRESLIQFLFALDLIIKAYEITENRQVSRLQGTRLVSSRTSRRNRP